jgi:phosphoribosylanthranilate isomerase
MKRVRIKICGLRRAEDVELCIHAGVDALGFNFYEKSPRYLPPQAAAPLVVRVPPSIAPVGIFVGAGVEQVRDAIARSGVRSIQLHGEEDPASYASLAPERIQVVRIQSGEPLPRAVSVAATSVLLDAWVEGFGGSGRRFDWDRAEEARRYGLPLLIAGGVTPENVTELLERLRPDGVDVASGVERSPGVKDPARVQALVQAVRRFEERSI